MSLIQKETEKQETTYAFDQSETQDIIATPDYEQAEIDEFFGKKPAQELFLEEEELAHCCFDQSETDTVMADE